MKNRAKCKLCQSIIESFHRHDYVSCKCGEIAIDGGQEMCGASARDFNNFLRIDDEGNEIVVQFVEKAEDVKPLYNEENIQEKPSKEKMIQILEEMIKNYESLPKHAMESPISHYDLLSVLILLSSILRS